MIRSLFFFAVASVALTACIPLGIPAIRGDIGLTTQRGASTGKRIDVGVALGSLLDKEDAPIDVGGGLLFEMLTKNDGVTDASSRGKYVDAAVVLHRWGFARLLAGARYEKYTSGTFVHAVKTRVDLEILQHVEETFSGGDAIGGAFGNAGVGLYAEAGPAWNAHDNVGWTATVGLSVRLPALGAIVFPSGGGGGGSSGSLNGLFGFGGP